MILPEWVCLVPTAFVLVLAVLTRRTIEPLLAGCVLGLALLDPGRLLTGLVDTALAVMRNDVIGWIILVCGLMGSLIALLVRIGGATAFGRMVADIVETRVGALLATWMLGLVIFIDDYLNSLTVSSAMRAVTEKLGISREMLAYVVDSTAAPVCVLIPLSTWAVYFAAVLEDGRWLAGQGGMSLYIQAIPFMLYPLIAVVLVPVTILGKLPLFRAMKLAEQRAAVPRTSAMDVSGDTVQPAHDAGGLRTVVLNFAIPILSLIAFTWYLDVNILKGVVVALAITLLLVTAQRLLPSGQVFDTLLDGFKSMLLPLGTVVAGFMLKEVNDQLRLADFVIDLATPVMTSHALPMVVFLTMALITFATGSFWGMVAVATPIILPLAINMDAHIPLVVGAMISASAFGSHACFYGDSTVLSAHGSGCSAMEHALTQLPYALLCAAIASVGYFLVAVLL